VTADDVNLIYFSGRYQKPSDIGQLQLGASFQNSDIFVVYVAERTNGQRTGVRKVSISGSFRLLCPPVGVISAFPPILPIHKICEDETQNEANYSTIVIHHEEAQDGTIHHLN
jgi:hypothetical protein